MERLLPQDSRPAALCCEHQLSRTNAAVVLQASLFCRVVWTSGRECRHANRQTHAHSGNKKTDNETKRGRERVWVWALYVFLSGLRCESKAVRDLMPLHLHLQMLSNAHHLHTTNKPNKRQTRRREEPKRGETKQVPKKDNTKTGFTCFRV